MPQIEGLIEEMEVRVRIYRAKILLLFLLSMVIVYAGILTSYLPTQVLLIPRSMLFTGGSLTFLYGVYYLSKMNRLERRIRALRSEM